MSKAIELFRKCRFSDLDIMVRNGEGEDVANEIETFDQCKFIAQHASQYSRLMECVSYTARIIADTAEQYLFAYNYSLNQRDKDEMFEGLRSSAIEPKVLVAIINNGDARIHNFGLQKVKVADYTFNEWQSIYDRLARSAQLSVLERMFEVASSYEEKVWVYNQMPRGRQEKLLPQIAEFLW